MIVVVDPAQPVCRCLGQFFWATAQQIGEIGHRRLHAIHGHGNMAAIEVAAMQNTLLFGINNRIVIGAIEFGFNKTPQPRQAIG